MKLYPIPGGLWETTEAKWKAAMKARGLDPKAFEATKSREVPTTPKDAFVEFLNFYAVDVYRTGTDTVVTGAAAVDVEALRAAHNPLPGHGDAPDTPSEATRQLAAMDNPGVDIEGIIKIIVESKGHLLKRFAGAVAGAFSALAV